MGVARICAGGFIVLHATETTPRQAMPRHAILHPASLRHYTGSHATQLRATLRATLLITFRYATPLLFKQRRSTSNKAFLLQVTPL